MAALLVFMLSSLKTEFETKKLFDGRDLFGCKVTLQYKNLARYIFSPMQLTENLIKNGYILKANN